MADLFGTGAIRMDCAASARAISSASAVRREERVPLDSRSSYVGCIDERDILGKVLLCFLPFSDFGVVK